MAFGKIVSAAAAKLGKRSGGFGKAIKATKSAPVKGVKRVSAGKAGGKSAVKKVQAY